MFKGTIEDLRIHGNYISAKLQRVFGGFWGCVCSLNFSRTVWGMGEGICIWSTIQDSWDQGQGSSPKCQSDVADRGMRSRCFFQVSIGDMADDGDTNFGYH